MVNVLGLFVGREFRLEFGKTLLFAGVEVVLSHFLGDQFEHCQELRVLGQ